MGVRQLEGGFFMKESGILQILENSRYTVVLTGAGMLSESGYPLLRDGEESYEIENKYGYSFEEIFSSGFYSARKELFFQLYKEVMLSTAQSTPPGRGYEYLKQLQDRGLIQAIVTRRIAGLEKRAGCANVVEMKGSIMDNVCPTCGRHYPIEYLTAAKGVPLCEQCLVAIRPQVCLFGEMINNALMTRAAEEVARAEVLIALGASLHSPLCSQLLQYYTGTNLILVTDSEHYSDQQADEIVYGRCDEFLGTLVSEHEHRAGR